MKRKPIQIDATERAVFALCDDGSIWVLHKIGDDTWERLPDIPQDKRQRLPKATTYLGQVDASVLQTIISTPDVTTRQLRKRPALRFMTPNILGTCLARLLKAGYITGPYKVGPFTPTKAGIAEAGAAAKNDG